MKNYVGAGGALYIHLPFCLDSCLCVGQEHYPVAKKTLVDEYHAALMHELDVRTDEIKQAGVDSIYIGGGTPIAYPYSLLLDMSGKLKNICKKNNRECTIEVSPRYSTPFNIVAWQDMGINRLTVLVDCQSIEDACKFMDNAQKRDMNIIGADCIIDRRMVMTDWWVHAVRTLIDHGASHITVQFFDIAHEVVSKLYDAIQTVLFERGFVEYYRGYFSRGAHCSRYMNHYWAQDALIGCGVGAESVRNGIRTQNALTIDEYMQDVSTEHKKEIDFVNPAQVRDEKLMLQMGRPEGIAFDQLANGGRWSNDRNALDVLVDQLVAQKILIRKDDRLSLSWRGISVQDELFSLLF